jgi:hypothetical protein
MRYVYTAISATVPVVEQTSRQNYAFSGTSSRHSHDLYGKGAFPLVGIIYTDICLHKRPFWSRYLI